MKSITTENYQPIQNDDHPEIIIVVDKLLTGFDAPRNTVLYIARSLQGTYLAQAIARVNRVHEGKDYGYIIDYYGILGQLNEALSTYSSLSEFDEDDLSGTLTSVDGWDQNYLNITLNFGSYSRPSITSTTVKPMSNC